MTGPQLPDPHFPAPWKLKGEGIILVYKFKRKWLEAHGLLSDKEIQDFKGGLGYVMLVNYSESPVGAYRELLFIPGKFKSHGKQIISKIYVDSEDSTANGRYNWGIPKETVPFIWQQEGNVTSIGVGPEENPILYCQIKRSGLPFPASTKILPIHLFQELEGKSYIVNPSGKGWGKLAKVESIKVNAKLFPDISTLKPLLSVHIRPFEIIFPKPE